MSNSFTSHFIELRSRLIKSIIFILLIFIISYTFAGQIYNFLVEPYAHAVKNDEISRRLIFTALDTRGLEPVMGQRGGAIGGVGG